MPQVIGAAIGAAGIGTGVAIGAGTTASMLLAGGSAITYAQIAGYAIYTAATVGALRALDDQIAAATAANKGRIINAREPAAPQEYVYGQVRKGGVITFMESTGVDNKYMHVVLVLAGHECEEIGDIYINDQVVTLDGSGFVGGRWNSKIRIKKHDGSQTTADADLVAETSATSTFVGNEIAYLYIRLEYDADVFAGGIPTFTAVVKGKKVYDPRTSVTAYSNNAALCLRDYITTARGVGDSNVNDTYFAAAANDCDDDITLDAGGTEKRYTINGVINSANPLGANIRDMVTACNGSLFVAGGTYMLKVGVYDASVKSFTLDDLRSEIDLQNRHGRSDNFNRVSGKFIQGGVYDADTNTTGGDWIETDYPSIESAAFLAEDGDDENTLDLPLYMTTSASAAQRIAKQTLYRSREQMTSTADFGLNALDVTVGDIVDLTVDTYGWTNKEFEVAQWALNIDADRGITITMTLRETSSAAFDWDAEETALTHNNTTLPDFDFVPDVGITLTSIGVIRSEKLLNSLQIDISSTYPDFVEQVEVEIKKSTDSTWTRLGFGELGRFEVLDLDRADYDVRARAINALGIKGTYETYSDFSVDATEGPPADVANLSFEVVGNTLNLSWDAVADLDLSYYRIRHSLAETGASWAASTTAIDKVARPGVSASLPLRSGTYHIRAYDKGGIPSTNYTSIVVPSTYLTSYTTTNTQTEDTAFSGTKTGVSVVSSALRLTSPVSASDSGTYDFSTYIDTGSSRLVWARIEADVTRIDDGSGTFDELPGLFDSLTGLFDDLGSGQYADHNVLFYISTTPDDPAGTPTWSSYQLFRAGNFYGRAFRFRVVLKTDTDDITPNLTSLAAIVEY